MSEQLNDKEVILASDYWGERVLDSDDKIKKYMQQQSYMKRLGRLGECNERATLKERIPKVSKSSSRNIIVTDDPNGFEPYEPCDFIKA